MRAVLAGALLVTSIVAPAGAAPKCPDATTSGRWTTITMPKGTNGWPAGVVPAAKRGQRDVLVASTERALWRSADGGCTWQQTFDLNTNPPADSRARNSVTLRWYDLSASGARGGARTLYALAVDSASVAISMPVAVATSTDGGARWKLYEPPAGPELTGHPRCTQGSRMVAGPDPAVAHLNCSIASLVEISSATPLCRKVVYVTTDAGATWRDATGRLGDPAHVGTDNVSGCRRLGLDPSAQLTADPVLTRGLWSLAPCEKTVYRSSDSGATLAAYGTVPAERLESCFPGFVVAGLPRGGQAVVLCDYHRAYVSTKEGTFAVTEPKLRVQERGSIVGCTWDARSARVLVFYSGGDRKQRVMTIDAARRSWRTLTYVPQVKDVAGWADYSLVEGEVSPVTGALYVRAANQGERLFRTAL